VVVLAVAFLGWLSYKIEPVRERWEATYYEGDTTGRDVIFSAAQEMFLEKLLTGWGPTNHVFELGWRLGLSRARITTTYISGYVHGRHGGLGRAT